MNGSLNSGGYRRVRLPDEPVTKPAKDPPPEPEELVDRFEKPAGNPINPVILLGNIGRETDALLATIKELPRSASNYENRLRAMLATCNTIARDVRLLIEDEAARLERDL